MILRKAAKDDLPAIMEIVAQAQRGLAERGVDQWQDGYPDEEAFLEDMAKGYCRVAVETGAEAGTRAGAQAETAGIEDRSAERILGVAAVIPDGEPDYDVIYGGEWLSEEPYMTVHRVAVDDRVKRKGVASFILSEAVEEACKLGLTGLRLDTHRDNLLMQKCLERNGLTRRGMIRLGRDGAERIAFEKRF